jgi:prepilin-type N-terminal cleavage/methylation domain-containing protein
MIQNKKVQMDQKGFTLVEIIAVLVILGILAAVAVPKFFDMQESSEYKSLDVAYNDMKSRAVAAFSKSMMEGNGVAVAANCGTWAALELDTTAKIQAAYKDFAGTWATDGTTITYTMKNGGSAITFTIALGTTTTPATLTRSALP